MKREERSGELMQALSASEQELDNRREVEFALREFEERHQTIIEGIEEGYVEVDLKGNTVFCNDSFCRITGYPKEELLGLNYREYMDEAMAKVVFAAYNEVYRIRVPNKGFNYEIIRKNLPREVTLLNFNGKKYEQLTERALLASQYEIEYSQIGVLDIITVVAYTDKAKANKGMSMLVVPKDAPGFSVGKEEKKLGIRG